jgi:hypothetical protein
MNGEMKSNITFSTNIFDDAHYSIHITEWDELVKYVQKNGKNGLSGEQKDLWHKGAKPYFCNNNSERAWGFIKNERGHIVQSCRCEKHDCSHFKECMNNHYAKKIIRTDDNISSNGVKHDNPPKWGVF